jgi:hypothetical protein
MYHDALVASTWFRISLSREQVEAGHISRIEEAVADLFAGAGSPAGAAGRVRRRSRMGGLLNYYERAA